jgi:hypothetical protein
VGSVFGDLLEKAQARGAITTWDVGAPEDCFTSWDIGIADSTAIWIWRVAGDTIEVIDFIEGTGKPITAYIDQLEALPYKFTKGHFLPHDSRARSFQTGVSTVELARERLGPGVVALPVMPKVQAIEAGRWLLLQSIKIHQKNCAAGLEALRAYRYEFSEERRTFTDRPLHDWSSHASDSWTYLAMAARPTIRRMKPAPEKAKREERPGYYPVNLEQMFEDHEKDKSGRKRI